MQPIDRLNRTTRRDLLDQRVVKTLRLVSRPSTGRRRQRITFVDRILSDCVIDFFVKKLAFDFVAAASCLIWWLFRGVEPR
jgi:hypothetical protein